MLGCMIEKLYTPAFLFYNKRKPPSASLPNKPLGGANNCIIIVSINC